VCSGNLQNGIFGETWKLGNSPFFSKSGPVSGGAESAEIRTLASSDPSRGWHEKIPNQKIQYLRGPPGTPFCAFPVLENRPCRYRVLDCSVMAREGHISTADRFVVP
jgi:hypothetical protein